MSIRVLFEWDTDGYGWYGFSRMFIRAHPLKPVSIRVLLNRTRMDTEGTDSHGFLSVPIC